MGKEKSIFNKIDTFVFSKIDQLKNDPSFQKMNDILATLDNDQQFFFSETLTFFLIIAPYLFIIFLWWGNSKIRQRIEIKNHIIEQVSLLNSNRENKVQVSSNLLAPTAILSKEDLDNKISNILTTSSIETNKVNVESFNQLSSTSSMSKIEASLNFNSFGTKDFINFMSFLSQNEKFKIVRVDLTADKTTQLLNGELSLIHLGNITNNISN